MNFTTIQTVMPRGTTTRMPARKKLRRTRKGSKSRLRIRLDMVLVREAYAGSGRRFHRVDFLDRFERNALVARLENFHFADFAFIRFENSKVKVVKINLFTYLGHRS